MGNVFLVVALVLFLLAAFSWPHTGRVSLGWLGLAFVVMSLLWPVMQALL